nr:Gag-Pol polyprotein [Tanacetum cinerariifolium]
MTTLAEHIIVVEAENHAPMLEKSMMTMQQVQVNTKFLNAHPSEWSKFVTDVKLPKILYTTNYDQLYTLAVAMFQQGEDLIECINKAMAFLSAVASRILHLLHILINHIIRIRIGIWHQSLHSGNLNSEGLSIEKLELLIYRNLAFQNEDLDAYDSDCDDLSSAKAVLMANLSSYDPEVLSEIKEDFGKRFVTQKELSAEQAFWLKHLSLSETPVKSHTPVRIEAPSKLSKQLRIDNDQLLNQIMSQEIVHIVVNFMDNFDAKKSCANDCSGTFTIVGNRCPLTRITSNEILPPKVTTIAPVVTPTLGILVYSRRPKATRSIGSSSKVKNVESKTSNSKEPKQSWGSTVFDVLSSSLNDYRLSKLFSGTVRFGNDHIDKIMGYGDYLIGNVTISRVYYVEGVVRDLPKLKYQKVHSCSACALGKSKKHSYKPKVEDSIQEKLYLLYMDLCEPMRVQSINGRKYILVIVDDFSRFTWVKFLRSKDEVPEFAIKFLKMIQVRLNATVRNIRTDNGTEFVNLTLKAYYEEVKSHIKHQLLALHNRMASLKDETGCVTLDPCERVRANGGCQVGLRAKSHGVLGRVELYYFGMVRVYCRLVWGRKVFGGKIVFEDDDDVAIKATPISSKSPTIVDYKIYKEGKKSYFGIIRADGNSQKYQTFETMFKNFNREDLKVLRSVDKERFKGLYEVTTAQLVLLVYKVVVVFNKVNAVKSRVIIAVRVSTAGWIKWLEDQDMQVNEIYYEMICID